MWHLNSFSRTRVKILPAGYFSRHGWPDQISVDTQTDLDLFIPDYDYLTPFLNDIARVMFNLFSVILLSRFSITQ